MQTGKEVESFIYSSYVNKHKNIMTGDDCFARMPRLTRELLDYFGAPDNESKNILITGSKGKGSLSYLLAKILEGEGKTIGLFTSPHLQNYRERIRVNGKAISEEDLVKIGNKLEHKYREIEAELKTHQYIGPVGATAVLAMEYFRQRQTDYNVIECGRGARFDDVNQIRGFICGINQIFLEHKGALGHNLSEVAHHKSGVIKEGMRGAFSAAQSHFPDLELRFEAKKKAVPLMFYGSDFRSENIRKSPDGSIFNILTKRGTYENVQLTLLGRHQIENATLAVAMAEEVLERKLDLDALLKTLMNISLHGRLEVLDKEPLTILDGCISRTAMPYIKEVLKDLKSDYEKKVVTVIGIPEDKDYLGVLKEAREFSKEIILTFAKNDYLKFSKEQVKESLKSGPIEFCSNVPEALDLGKKHTNGEDVLLLLGTQSFIKDVEKYYGRDTLNI